MVSWGTIKSLALFFGPMLLPKAISYYRSVRAAPGITGKKIQPVPPYMNRALVILFAIAVISLLSTLPYFASENLFSLTQSRLQIPIDVLFTRLSAIRPHGLTEMDNVLRHKLLSLESRLLYFQYGPDVIADCPFCNADNTMSYFYYALPALLTPHLFNLSVLGLVTSGLFVGTEATRWRTVATIGAIVLAGLDIYSVATYSYQSNSKATRLEDVDNFFWKMRVYRGVGVAALDGVVGYMMWLSCTNRAFVVPIATVERIETSLKLVDSVRSKMNAATVVRNSVARDEGLRTRTQGYWTHEGRLTREMMEDREVLQGVNNALDSRINIDRISADAEMYASRILGGDQVTAVS